MADSSRLSFFFIENPLLQKFQMVFLLFVAGIEAKMERLSTQTQESGFVSMHSQRSSSQSYTASSMTSKRSSQQSSISYNSQSFSSQQQSFSQQKLAADNNGTVYSHKTITSSKSSVSTTNVTSSGDPTLLEKLVNVGVACFFIFLYCILCILFCLKFYPYILSFFILFLHEFYEHNFI